MRRRLKTALKWISVVALAMGVLAAAGWIYLNPSIERTNGVVYNKRGLTMDVMRPHSPNGLAVALMVSGGWKSKHAGETPLWLVAQLLRAGYTVFAVCHTSQPESTVMEIIQDMNRGIRFIRYHAKD